MTVTAKQRVVFSGKSHLSHIGRENGLFSRFYPYRACGAAAVGV